MREDCKIKACLLLIFLIFTLGSVHVKGQAKNIKHVRNVLILGNSITKHTPNPDLGWFGDWGMAASEKEKDYVHDLFRMFRQVDPGVDFKVKTIVDFERSYWDYDFSNLDSSLSSRPELVIIHIGENVPAKMLDEKPFAPYYGQLLSYIVSNDPEVKIICTSSFWDQKRTSAIIKEETEKMNCAYVKIDQLSADSSNMAIGKFENKGVAIHPSDAGMKAMADLIWQKIISIYKID